jgi:hypothetical protein
MESVMKRTALAIAAVVLVSSPSFAQQAQPQFPNMSFFITSTGGPDGGNLGGLEGADRLCQSLAAKHGAGGKTWRAYLSTQAEGGKPAVNARDRIGKGPWVNAKGVQVAANLEELHDQSKVKINAATGLAENGRLIPSRLYSYNMHDILTGTKLDGTAFPPGKDMTCGNWTKNTGTARIGHFDRMSRRETVEGLSWNSAHPTRGCSHEKFRLSGGSGLLYCFAEK